MPRHARIVHPGVPMHAVQRGNNRSSCFVDDEDRRFYLLQLARLSRDEACDLHAYCLMTNHVHLLFTPHRADSCERFFRRLSLLYVQYVNRKYGRTGTLWEGRFRSSLVESERYLMACYRYIERNPIRAGMVEHPRQYRWSSYGINAEGAADPCVTPHAEYLRLGTLDSGRRRAYAQLLDVDLDPGTVDAIRSTINAGYALGSEAFRKDMERRLGRRVGPGVPGRPRRAAVDEGQERPF